MIFIFKQSKVNLTYSFKLINILKFYLHNRNTIPVMYS